MMSITTNQIALYFFQSIGFFMTLFFLVQFLLLRRKEHLFYAGYLFLLWTYMFAAMPEYFFQVNPNDPAQIAPYYLYKRPLQ